jgi:hypothetical protein
MAAKLVCPTDCEWEVLESFFRQCGGGAIVLSPKAQRQIREWGGHTAAGIELADYDFGGEPDVMLDVVRCLAGGEYAVDAVCQALAPTDSQ